MTTSTTSRPLTARMKSLLGLFSNAAVVISFYENGRSGIIMSKADGASGADFIAACDKMGRFDANTMRALIERGLVERDTSLDTEYVRAWRLAGAAPAAQVEAPAAVEPRSARLIIAEREEAHVAYLGGLLSEEEHDDLVERLTAEMNAAECICPGAFTGSKSAHGFCPECIGNPRADQQPTQRTLADLSDAELRRQREEIADEQDAVAVDEFPSDLARREAVAWIERKAHEYDAEIERRATGQPSAPSEPAVQIGGESFPARFDLGVMLSPSDERRVFTVERFGGEVIGQFRIEYVRPDLGLVTILSEEGVTAVYAKSPEKGTAYALASAPDTITAYAERQRAEVSR